MNPLADLISSVRIDARCTACGNCIVTCPETALLRAPKRPAVVDDLCTSCGACIEVCPVDAIQEIAVNTWTSAGTDTSHFGSWT